MKWKRSLALALAVILACSLLLPTAALADGTETFSGSRTLTFTADSSNLNNFLDGGREALDLALRYSAPDWLVYSLKAQDRDVVLTLRIDFTSLEEYTARLSQLLGYSAPLIHIGGSETVLLEDFYPTELLNFLQQTLNITESQTHWSLEKLLPLTSDQLTLGAESYEFQGEKIQVCPAPTGAIRLQQLDISTAEANDGTLTRTVTLRSDSATFVAAEWNDLIARCEATGETATQNTTSGSDITVEFTARSHEELAEKTSFCLGSTVYLSEDAQGVEDGLMVTQRTEYYPLTSLLAAGGSFRYTYEYPDRLKDMTALDSGVTVSDGTVCAENQGYIQLLYRRSFRFETVSVKTAYSLFGKTRRTICLSAPTDAAKLFHQQIKEELEDRLIPGTALDIYDQDGTRYYELCFSSWFDGDIAEFTQAILGSGTLERSDSWLPFGESTLEERIPSTTLISRFGEAENVELSYTFPVLTKVKTDDSSAEISGGTVRFSGIQSVALTYHGLNAYKTILELLGVLILLIPILLLVRAIRRRKKKAAPKAAEAPAPKPHFCTKCGARLEPGNRFCTACGAPQEPRE